MAHRGLWDKMGEGPESTLSEGAPRADQVCGCHLFMRCLISEVLRILDGILQGAVRLTRRHLLARNFKSLDGAVPLHVVDRPSKLSVVVFVKSKSRSQAKKPSPTSLNYYIP